MAVQIIILILFVLFFIIIYLLYSDYSSRITRMIAQFNVLRLWISHYFGYLSDSIKDDARKELADIIIDNEDYTIVKEWYKFFFNKK